MIGKVEGDFGTNVVLKESTYKSGSAWLFIRNSTHGPVKGALHINTDGAIELIEALKLYVESQK